MKSVSTGYGLRASNVTPANVWEWTQRLALGPTTTLSSGRTSGVSAQPAGALTRRSIRAEPTERKRRVHRGEIRTYCTDQYMFPRYMVGTRGKGEGSTGTNHVGFRLVKTS